MGMINKYYATFPFKGDYQYITFDSNQLANEVLPHTDDILEFTCNTDGQKFMQQIYHKGKKYDVTFGSKPQFVSVYNPEDLEDETLAGYIVEKDIPWTILKIENNKEEIYNITDYL